MEKQIEELQKELLKYKRTNKFLTIIVFLTLIINLYNLLA